MKSPYEILMKPIITEKSTVLAELTCPQYVFKVHPAANKVEIRKAVEAAWNVKVKSVNTQKLLGKQRRLRAALGRRPNWKKAVVTLQEGQSIPLY